LSQLCWERRKGVCQSNIGYRSRRKRIISESRLGKAVADCSVSQFVLHHMTVHHEPIKRARERTERFAVNFEHPAATVPESPMKRPDRHSVLFILISILDALYWRPLLAIVKYLKIRVSSVRGNRVYTHKRHTV